MNRDQPSQHNTFPLLDLPLELLSLIGGQLELKHLTTLFLSCRRMHKFLTSTGQHLDLSPYAQHVTPAIVTRLIEKFFKKLVSVNLNGCSNLSDESVIQLAEKYNEKLVALDLTGCSQITDDTLTALAKHCTKLTSINLARCPHITDSAIENLAKECTLLPKVNLIDDSQPSRQALVDLCDELRDIGLDSDDVSLINDAASRNLSIHLNRLTSITSEDLNITGEVIMLVATHCTNLEEFDVAYELDQDNQPPSNTVLTTLVENGRLTNINLEWSRDIDEVVEALAHNNPRLIKVGLNDTDISHESIVLLIQCCPEIRALHISGNKKIQDKTIEFISIHCHNLEYLSIIDCHITEEAIFTLAKYFVKLDVISHFRDNPNPYISFQKAKETLQFADGVFSSSQFEGSHKP